MSPFRKPAKQAQRRLWLNRWLGYFGWSLVFAAAVLIPAVLLDRLWLSRPDATRWLAIGAGILIGCGFVISLVWALLTRESLTVAALKLDEAAKLRERLSTALFCEKLSDPFAQAVIVDAQRVTQGLRLSRFLPIRWPKSAAYAGSTWLLALLFFWLFPAIDLSGKQAQRDEQQVRQQEIQRTTATLKPIIQQQIDKVGEQNPQLKNDLSKIDPLKDAKLETPLDVRREAVKQVGKISDKLEARRNSNELSQMDELKRMMRRVGENSRKDSQVGELAKSLAKSDFKSAKQALEDIKAELAKTPKSAEEEKRQKELREQLSQLADKLEQLAQDTKQLENELSKSGLTPEEIKKALENISKEDTQALKDMLTKKGLTQEQIESLMKKACKNGKACKSACKLAKCLKDGSKSGGSGQGQQGLGKAGEQLSELEALQQELDSLNASLSDLESLKDQIGQCQSQCNKPGPGMGNLGIGMGGVADKQPTDFKLQAQRTPIKSAPGAIISQQFIEGEQFKGDVSKDYADTAMAAQREVSEAIAKEQIPRPLQGPIKKYFNRTVSDLPSGAQPTENTDGAKPK